ncbi:hypothetical protein DU508_10855 [Pedobacter chinensis]|uniref:Uncharacterized protein n=1 Tax=Pedobacter chinensis TaxID=2282421 RepID=A0A369PZD6_9SPHI|nr:hypothetical protein DU508_10855 [Pedobacter chinensis]
MHINEPKTKLVFIKNQEIMAIQNNTFSNNATTIAAGNVVLLPVIILNLLLLNILLGKKTGSF